MSYMKVEHDNFFSRMGKSLAGCCVGFLLFLASFALLAWNENNIRTSALALGEAQGALEAGRASYITGDVEGCKKLADGTFGITAELPGLLALKRESEQFQVVEHSKTRKQKTAGGGETRVTEYSYSREWKSNVVDSSSFEDNSYRNANPNEFAAASETRWCADVSLAGVALPRQAVEDLAAASWARLDVHDPEVSALAAIGSADAIAEGGDADDATSDGSEQGEDDDVATAASEEIRRANRKDREERRGGRADGRDRRAARDRQRASRAASKRALAASSASRSLVAHTLYDNAVYSGDPTSPRVGDERYRFHAASAPEASAVGVISSSGGGSSKAPSRRVLKPIRTSLGREILLTGVGHQDAHSLFDTAHKANAAMGWLLRGAGWLLMFLGLVMVFGPISVAPQAVPLIGGFVSSIISGGLGIAAFILSLGLSTITIAISWFAVRPAMTVSIVVAVLGALYLLRGMRSGAAGTPAAAAATAQTAEAAPAAAAATSASPVAAAADADEPMLRANRKPTAAAAPASSEPQ